VVVAGNYRGDVTPDEAWAVLSSDGKAALVDVRTAAETVFVGLADLSSVGREVIRVEWQSFPSMAVDPEFSSRIDTQLQAADIGPDDPVFFLCRSGARSAAAAAAMTVAGYSHCLNVSSGFEGDPDSDRHRGNINGWKVAGLPWVQS
jgi:rhodanese-related sulfurtransferase